MKKIVYLFGTGASQAELDNLGIEKDVTMSAISDAVYDLSKEMNGKYYNLIEEFRISPIQDVEMMMSLFEDHFDLNDPELFGVYKELKSLFRKAICERIPDDTSPELISGLFYMNKEYPHDLGIHGEKIISALTINYDPLIEKAISNIFGAVNYSIDVESSTFEVDDVIFPLIKLHGSFDWALKDKYCFVESNLSNEDNNGWIPPSVFKRPEKSIYKDLWINAFNVLSECDTLRIIGSSLRKEDYALLSLVFTSQIKSDPPYEIELIIPEKDGRDIVKRIPFLGRPNTISTLLPMEDLKDRRPNIFLEWIKMMVETLERKNDKVKKDDTLYGFIGEY